MEKHGQNVFVRSHDSGIAVPVNFGSSLCSDWDAAGHTDEACRQDVRPDRLPPIRAAGTRHESEPH